MSSRSAFVLLLIALARVGHSTFSPHFRQWIIETHGEQQLNWIEREDLGGEGSFGGMENDTQIITNHPVVFVHGVSNVADKMRPAANHYMNNGYSMGELYATTYDNPRGDAMKWVQYRMSCVHVKRIRFMIEAVHNYTGSLVDVVAYSMGVPITRKAILGGKCVENGNEVGAPITDMVGTFLGIAGPNKGVAPVIAGLPYALCAINPLVPVCNPTDGLYSGICPIKSKFIGDINSRDGYEGGAVYTMGSIMDEVIGHKICGEVTTRIRGQKAEKIFNDKKHSEVFHHSYDLQLKMLRGEEF